MSERKPLTLEELREMTGKPVWIERNDPPHDGKWDLVGYAYTDCQDKTLYTKSGVTYSEYGKYFTAYASEPRYLDRSAWKKCELCDSCASCKKSTESVRDIYNDCFWCNRKDKFEPMNFCPSCGRPLTEEAWNILATRLSNLGGNL